MLVNNSLDDETRTVLKKLDQFLSGKLSDTVIRLTNKSSYHISNTGTCGNCLLAVTPTKLQNDSPLLQMSKVGIFLKDFNNNWAKVTDLVPDLKGLVDPDKKYHYKPTVKSLAMSDDGSTIVAGFTFLNPHLVPVNFVALFKYDNKIWRHLYTFQPADTNIEWFGRHVYIEHDEKVIISKYHYSRTQHDSKYSVKLKGIILERQSSVTIDRTSDMQLPLLVKLNKTIS